MATAAAKLPRPLSSSRLGDAAFYVASASLVALFTISNALLEIAGYHYGSSGGLPWEKFHPATLLVLLALLLRSAATPHPLTTAARIVDAQRWLLLYLFAIGCAALHAAVVSQSPVTPLVDTFTLPVFFIWLLTGLQPAYRERFALLVCVCLAANDVLAIGEYLSGKHLIGVWPIEGATSDPSRTDVPFDPNVPGEGEWRATAFLGHPLVNALTTGGLIVALASPGARWMPPRWRFSLLGLSAAAMVAFGGRASLVLALFGAALFAIAAGARHLAAGRGLPRRVVIGVVVGVPILIAVAVALYSLGLFDRPIERFVNDAGSANARIVMWDMLTPFSFRDLAFGPDPDVVATWQRMLGLEYGIESFWLGIVLTYGVLVGGILFAGLAIVCACLISASGRGTAAVLVYFFLVASTSTSLSSKGTGFAQAVVLIILLLPRSARRA